MYPYKFHVFAHCHPAGSTTTGGTCTSGTSSRPEDLLKQYAKIDFKTSDVASLVRQDGDSLAKKGFSNYEFLEQSRWPDTLQYLQSQSKLDKGSMEEQLTNNFKDWLAAGVYDDHEVEVQIFTDMTALDAAFQETVDRARAGYVRPRATQAELSKDNAYRKEILGLTESDD